MEVAALDGVLLDPVWWLVGAGVRLGERIRGLRESEIEDLIAFQIALHPAAGGLDGDGVVLLGVPGLAGLPGIHKRFERAEAWRDLVLEVLEVVDGQWWA